ncbi:MAG: hypothetical protein DMG30_12640 [Acidobacteria bacterium]|nr:MAG: hypothetical protein DMG30_12640 [Acidobacteriota bacterium]
MAVISVELRDGPVMGPDVAGELRAYPDGILSRDDSFPMLCNYIRAVYEGQVWTNSRQLQFVIEALIKRAPRRMKYAQGASMLTQREEGLVQLVAQGLTNRETSQP